MSEPTNTEEPRIALGIDAVGATKLGKSAGLAAGGAAMAMLLIEVGLWPESYTIGSVTLKLHGTQAVLALGAVCGWVINLIRKFVVNYSR